MDPEDGRLTARMKAEGRKSAKLVRISLWLDWALIAIEHERQTHDARGRAASELARDQIKAMSSMKEEFRSAMVTVTAASHSIDAFYSAVHPYVPLPQELRDVWNANRTKRATRIIETIKHGFDTGHETQELGDDLRWLFNIRDQAVHFQEDYRDPVPHPLIPANAAPEDVMFSAESARRSVELVVRLVDRCTSRVKRGPRYRDLSERTKAMRPFTEMILEARETSSRSR